MPKNCLTSEIFRRLEGDSFIEAAGCLFLDGVYALLAVYAAVPSYEHLPEEGSVALQLDGAVLRAVFTIVKDG